MLSLLRSPTFVLNRAQDRILASERLYRLWLRNVEGATFPPCGIPSVETWCTTLKRESEWRAAITDARNLGLPLHNDPSKTWDTRIAVAALLTTTEPNEAILDAGATLDSRILTWLYLYGRRDLTGINLVFKRPIRRGPIRFEFGDLTRSRFEAGSFGGIACQSVIEHGVDLSSYLAEMARLLRKGGVLVTSTDYFPEPVETGSKVAYGVPIKIFTRTDMLRLFDEASRVGLELTHPPDLDCNERPICWERFGLRYTFTCFALRKGKA